MKNLERILLIIIIIMGIWIIYRDSTYDARHKNILQTELPQLIQDAIYQELYPPELIHESETNK